MKLNISKTIDENIIGVDISVAELGTSDTDAATEKDTQSGTSDNEGGGQTKNEDDLSDEGLATREGEKDVGTQAGN